jgi:two-component system, NtrC family, sensor kinase
LAFLQEEYGSSLVDLGVVDENGIQTVYAGPFRLSGADYSKSHWFSTALSRPYFITDVFYGLRNVPHFAMTVTLERGGKKFLLRATLTFEALSSFVESVHMGTTGCAFIINREGKLQTKAPQDFSVPTPLFMNFFSAAGKRPDEVRVVEQPDRSGVEEIYLMTSLKEGDWILGYYQEAHETFSALYSARAFAIGIFLAGLIAILIAAVILSRRFVTHIETADAEKHVMNEQLVEAGKLASLGEMAAGIAHEINNPVGIMIQEAGWIQDLVDEVEENTKHELDLDELKRSLTRIQTQGKRCREITHKLLSFARKTDPATKEAQLNEIVEDVTAISEQRARFSNIKINRSLQKDLPTVKVSPTEVQQILLNLINNSLDALGTRGGEIDITTRSEDNCVMVDVADNGPGIPKANLNRIFEPFFTTKPVGKGTGLGLSICYGIAKKMGGDIRVDSELDKGTTFHILFPVGKVAAAKPEP